MDPEELLGTFTTSSEKEQNDSKNASQNQLTRNSPYLGISDLCLKWQKNQNQSF